MEARARRARASDWGSLDKVASTICPGSWWTYRLVDGGRLEIRLEAAAMPSPRKEARVLLLSAATAR